MELDISGGEILWPAKITVRDFRTHLAQTTAADFRVWSAEEQPSCVVREKFFVGDSEGHLLGV